MTRTFAIRLLSLYAPLAAAFFVWQWRRPSQLELTGGLLASAWNVPALFAINLLAIRMDWWRFDIKGASVVGMPIDLWLGWAVVWGFVVALLFRGQPLLIAVSVCACADVILMPLCRPVLVLGKTWLLGEGVALLLCLSPGLLFAQWTADRRNVKGRALFQAICFSELLFMSVFLLLTLTGELERITQHRSATLQCFATLLFLAALPGLSAVQEFAIAGDGTPLPFDPPKRLVTSGVYSYVGNPMQTSTALLFFTLAVILYDWHLLLACFLTIAYSAGLASWDEGRDLQQRHGRPFVEYRRHVRDWLPRWRPYVAADTPTTNAKIYFAGECGKCSELAAFVRRLNPAGLEILAAENHPTRDLQRMTYEVQGRETDGLGALARALEHVNLGWALFGMFLRLPGLNQLLQAVLDVSGGEPMKVTRCTTPLTKGAVADGN
jgi:protein-S-isoprenylcysteine O-methyltransferase Ste14